MSHRDDLPYIVIERRSAGVAAFVYGALIGAGVALLFAPRSGRETRDELRAGAKRVRSRAEDAVRQVQDTVTGTFEDVREEVNDRLDAAREAFEAGRHAARSTRDEMEQRVRQARAGVRAGVDAARHHEAESVESGRGARTDLDEETPFGV
jgi:gas vesicle protein